MSNSESERGYLSGFSEYENVEIPLPHGQFGPFGRTSEEVLVKNVAAHVADKIAGAVEAENTFAYKDQKTSPEILGHYLGSLQGLKLIDAKTSKDLDSLLTQFSRVGKTERRQFVKTKLRPLLTSLRPAKRQS